MLGIIDNICKDFDQQRTQYLFLINLDQSKLIIPEVNVEKNSSATIQGNKYNNGGFLHVVIQVIDVYDLDESSFIDDDAKFLMNAIIEISRDIFGPSTRCIIVNVNVRYNMIYIFNVQHKQKKIGTRKQISGNHPITNLLPNKIATNIQWVPLYGNNIVSFDGMYFGCNSSDCYKL